MNARPPASLLSADALRLTVTVIGVVVATLPAASYARALRVWLPLSLRAFQLKLYGYEVSTSFSAPSIHNSTLATPTCRSHPPQP